MMSTIERAAARLGSIGKARTEPTVAVETDHVADEPAALDTVERKVEPSVADSLRGGYCELDLESLASRGFVSSGNTQTEIAADLRRIKRPLLLSIKHAEARRETSLPPNLVLITSSLPGEGKTFVSINLALSLAAEVDRSVLLVDADVAKGDVARVLDIPVNGGLSELLQESAAFAETAVMQTNVATLSIMLAGKPLSNVDELFASERMTQLLHDLAAYDSNRIVVIDGPPLHAGTEASVLARMVGQVVVLVEADKTPQSTVTEALQQLKSCASVSLVLNKARRRASERRVYGYGYGYGGAGN
jgi:protein-tyrosine kinase